MSSDVACTLAPIPLIVEDGSGKYECHAEGLEFLRHCSAPVAVIVVAGRYRTGKSFLLNRGILRLPPNKGFTTGNTVNACTKGIWAYPKLVTLPGKNIQALILDSEGTGSSEGTPAQDAKLISIAVALASIFVFNSVGALDEACFSEIGILAHAAQMLQNQSSEAWQTPDLVWVLRDFSLLLQNTDGDAISANSYLERCLSEADKGEARELLRTYFAKRSLFTLVRPVAEEENLRRLNTLSNDDLRPEFVVQLNNFYGEVCTQARVKTIGGHPATGSVLAHLCMGAVKAVNDGSCPCISDSLTFLLELDLAAAIKAATADTCTAAQACARLLPLPPQSIKLTRPLVPASLSVRSAWCERFQSEIEEICVKHEELLAAQNTTEQARWVRDFLESAAKDSKPLSRFECFLRTAHETLGVQCAHESCLLAFEVCADHEKRASVALLQDAAALRASDAAQRLRIEALAEENDEIRAELDASLMTNIYPTVDESEMLEGERAHSKILASELGKAKTELEISTKEWETVSYELSALQEEREEQRCEASALADRGVSEEIRRMTELQSDVTMFRETLKVQEENEQCRLMKMQQDMMRVLEETQSKFAARQEIDSAFIASEETEIFRLARCEEQLTAQEQKEREVAQDLRNQLAAAEKEQSAVLLQQKRKHTEQYAEKSSIMREYHEQSLLELQKTREKVLESERARVRLEIENQVSKRSCDSHREDMQQLAKTRRYAEDLRDRLADRESSARTSSSLLEDTRRRIVELEDTLRIMETTHSAETRKKDYKIAMLEFQLQALGGSSSG